MERILRRKGRLVRLGVVLAVMLLVGAVFVGPVQAEGEPDGDESYVVATRCVGFGAFPQGVAVDAATVREVGQIPDDFKLRGEEHGKAFLQVGAFICNPALIDGVDAGPFLYSNVTVSLESHAGGYDIWQFTDLPALHSRLRQIGIFSPLLKDMSVEIHPTAGAPVFGTADIPWTASPYTMDATIDPAPAPLVAGVDACSSPPQPSADRRCFKSDHWF